MTQVLSLYVILRMGTGQVLYSMKNRIRVWLQGYIGTLSCSLTRANDVASCVIVVGKMHSIWDLNW